MKKVFNKLTISVTLFILVITCFLGCAKKNNDPIEPQTTEIKNVIIVIGDGMGLEQIKAGEIYERKDYAFKKWHNTTVNTDSINGTSYVLTDSAAGGTAIATGTLTKNGYVGKTPQGNDLETVLDLAKTLGKSTAVITTDKLYGATPASFSAHSLSRDNTNEIIESQINTSNVDILCGTFSATCQSYLSLIKEKGYEYCTDFSAIDEILNKDKHYWQFDLAGAGATVELHEVVEKALTVLEKEQDGFTMMIEQAYIDKYCHNNEIEGTVKSVKSLNQTVELIMQWIGKRKDTAVLITADHETGGLKISENQEEIDDSWSLLPNKSSKYYKYTTGDHTRTPIGLFTYGITPKFEEFTFYKSASLIKNIETNQIIKNAILNKTA